MGGQSGLHSEKVRRDSMKNTRRNLEARVKLRENEHLISKHVAPSTSHTKSLFVTSDYHMILMIKVRQW